MHFFNILVFIDYCFVHFFITFLLNIQKREDAIIEKNINKLNCSNLEEYYLEWFKSMLKVSKDYQKKIIGDNND